MKNLRDAGYDLIRLHPWDAVRDGRAIGKSPINEKWTDVNECPTMEADEAERWLEKGNVGVRLRGTDLVIDVDPRNFKDGDSEKLLAEKFGIVWDKYPRVDTPSGGRHYYMRLPPGTKLRTKVKEFPGIDFKSLGGQVVAPGSRHPNGGIYEWDPCSPDFPAEFVPGVVTEYLSWKPPAAPSFFSISPEQLTAALDKLKVENFRDHDTWFRLMCACHEATSGGGEDEFVLWSTSDPEYSAQEGIIRARWRSLESGKEGNAGVGTLESILLDSGVVEMGWRQESAANDFDGVDEGNAPLNEDERLMVEMSEEFFCVDAGGDLRIFRHVQDETLKRKAWRQYRRQAFLDVCKSVKMYKDVTVMRGEKLVSVPAGEHWLTTWKDKKTFEGVVFAPECGEDKTPGGCFNLWRGFAVDPRPGRWDMMKRVILEVLCQGDRSHYDYIVKWLARAVQEPGTPGEVALVLKGPKGVGKSTLGRTFCRLFGAHGLQVTSPAMLVGRFNSHLRDVVALFADEAFWAGDKNGESILKGLVTETMVTYEGKGTNAEIGRNCTHLIVASNSDWVVPAGMDQERRFAVFEAAGTPMPQEFWAALWEQMENGGYEAMLWDLLKTNLRGFNVRVMPKTEALMRQQTLTNGPFENWLIEFIDSGDWSGIRPVRVEGTHTMFLKEDIILSVEMAYRRSGFKPGMLQQHVGMRLNRLLSELCVTRRISRPEDRQDIEVTRPWAYLFAERRLLMKRIQQLMGVDPFSSEGDTDDYL